MLAVIQRDRGCDPNRRLQILLTPNRERRQENLVRQGTQFVIGRQADMSIANLVSGTLFCRAQRASRAARRLSSLTVIVGMVIP